MVVKMKKARCIVALIVVIMMVITLMPSSRNTAEAATSSDTTKESDISSAGQAGIVPYYVAKDVVFVLDTTPSMLEEMTTGNTQKVVAMQNAVNAFIDALLTANNKVGNRSEQSDKQSRISIIGYNDKTNLIADYTYVTDSTVSSLKTTVNKVIYDYVAPAYPGDRRTNDALKMANEQVTSKGRSWADQVVVVLSDGQPEDTRTDGTYDNASARNRAAGKAVEYAKGIKDSGAVVYSVGIFKGANIYEVNLATANSFLHAVSSDYPEAAPTITTDAGSSQGYYDGFTLGIAWPGWGYYKTASSSEELTETFNEIFNEITYGSSTAPASEYSITATAGDGGTISPASKTTVASGGSQQYTITAEDGYRISDVQVDGKSVGAVSSYEFTDVTADHTIHAIFEKVEQAGSSSGDDDSDVTGTTTNTGSANTTGGSSGFGSTATGDYSNPALWVALAMMALMGAATTVVYRRKKS